MIPDDEGFLYPKIDNEKCSQCSLCTKTCPFHKGFKKGDNFASPLVFAAKHKDINVRMKSSSGGMFTALSDLILSNGGVVYGVVFDDEKNVIHTRTENTIDRDRMRGSKYIQSKLNQEFHNVKRDLLNNRQVLFTGTPCQIAGLESFLVKIDKSKLLLCDIVCHGVASPRVWELYIELLQKKYKQKIAQFYFRYKTGISSETIQHAVLVDGGQVIESDLEIFNLIYFGQWASRPSCHNCVFTKMERLSDITIADFWGIEKYNTDFNDGNGVSLVLVNSERGRGFLEAIGSHIVYIESSTEKCMQPNLCAPSKPSLHRDPFMMEIGMKKFIKILKRYGIVDSGLTRIKKKIKRWF
jgi:coenzyme F420-reducing hydrogenase beta subunit